jgi:hypothetical protein
VEECEVGVRETAGAGELHEASRWGIRRVAGATSSVDGAGRMATPGVNASAADIQACSDSRR